MASFGEDASVNNNGSPSVSGILNGNADIRKSVMQNIRYQYFPEHHCTHVDIPNEPILNNLASNKGLESELADPKKSYENKVMALTCAWEKISSFVLKRFNPANQGSASSLIRWIHPITLQVVFNTSYTDLNRAMKTHMEVTLNRCLSVLKNEADLQILRALIRIVQDPWNHPTLNRIFDRRHTTVDHIHNSEALSLCNTEKAMTLAMRLEMLVRARCDDFACKLAQVCMRCMELDSCDVCDDGPDGDQRYVHFIVDVCIALLTKAKRFEIIFERLKFYDVGDGNKIVARFLERHRQRQRSLWRVSKQAAEIATQYFMVSSMLLPVDRCEDLAAMMVTWLDVRSGLPNVIPDLSRAMIKHAASSRHIFLLSNALQTQFGDRFTSLCIEFYIRGLTLSMNELEYLKSFTVKDVNNIRAMEVRMSDGFLQLAELAKDNMSVRRESLLTAFSLNPTEECYGAVMKVAAESGMIPPSPVLSPVRSPELIVFNENFLLKEVCVTSVPLTEEPGCSKHSSTGTGALCSKCGRFAKEVQHHDVQLEGAELLGLTEQMCDDLIVILGSPRWHFLSWELDWSALSDTCEKYLKEGSTRNTEIELKHLSKHIDYDQFKDWKGKEDDYPGIEKGYEDCLLDEEEEEPIPKPKNRKRSRRTDSDSSYEHKKRGRKPKKQAEAETKSKSCTSRKKKNLFLSSVSDYDTGTQDSFKTDATYSDGYLFDSPRDRSQVSNSSERSVISEEFRSDIIGLARRKGQSKYATRGSKKKKTQQEISNESSLLVTNHDSQLDGQKDNDVSISIVPNSNSFLLGDKNGMTYTTDLSRVVPYNAQRVSDPKILQQLRMFRAKKPSLHNENQPKVKGVEGQATYPSGLSSLSILLQRSDESLSPSKKPLSSNNGLADPALNSLICRKTDTSKALFGTGNKPRPLMGLEFLSSVILIEHKRERELLDREILKSHVPGLNTLDMMIPPPLEATVQIVQLAQSVPTPSSTEDNNQDGSPTAKPHSQDSPPQSTSQSAEQQPVTAPSSALARSRANASQQRADNLAATSADLVSSSQHHSPPPRPDQLQFKNVQHNLDVEVTVYPEQLLDTADPRGRVEDAAESAAAGAGEISSSLPPSLPVTSHSRMISLLPSDNQLVLLPNETNSVQAVEPPNEISEPSAEGLPKFHQAFNKGSRSIYCQTTPANVTSSKEGEENPVSNVEQATVPPQGQNKPNPVPSDIGPTETLEHLNIVLPSSLAEGSTGPIIRVIRGSSQHSTPSMVYIGPVNASRANLISAELRHGNAAAHFANPNPGGSVSAMLRPIVMTKDSPAARIIRPTLQPFQIRTPVPCTLTSGEMAQTVCVVESSSDDEATGQQKQPVKPAPTQPAQATRVIRQVLQVQGGNIHRSQLSALQPIQSYPAAAAAAASLNDLKPEEAGSVSQSNVLAPAPVASVSSTTLEQQLREFDSVLKQYTDTSKMKEKGEIREDSPTKSPAVAVATHAIPQVVQTTVMAGAAARSDFPAHISCLKVPVSRIVPVQASAVSMPGNVVKSTKVTKVVMVASNCQPLTSPAITLTAESLSSPAVVTQAASVAATSPGKTPPSKSSKSSKSKSAKSSPSTSTGSKSSPVPKPQQKPQEDEQTAQRIYQILGEYAEQLRNSPDLNNKPAPRRRSNPPTNPSQSSKRKKSSQSKVKLLGQSSSSAAGDASPGVDDPATLGSEDSSSNMMLLSQVHDSPAPSQSADETLSVPPSLESSTEGGNLKSVVTDSAENNPPETNPPPPRQQQQGHTLICSTVQGMFVKEGAQGAGGDAHSATMVKPLLLGSAGNLPIYVQGNMQRMLMQTLKGQKLIRVQQVSVPGGPGSSGMQGTTLVLRQMMQHHQAPTKQQQSGKVPVVTVSSQSLGSIAGHQPMMVAPLAAAGTSRVISFTAVTEDVSPSQPTLVSLLARTPASFQNQLANAVGSMVSTGCVPSLHGIVGDAADAVATTQAPAVGGGESLARVLSIVHRSAPAPEPPGVVRLAANTAALYRQPPTPDGTDAGEKCAEVGGLEVVGAELPPAAGHRETPDAGEAAAASGCPASDQAVAPVTSEDATVGPETESAVAEETPVPDTDSLEPSNDATTTAQDIFQPTPSSAVANSDGGNAQKEGTLSEANPPVSLPGLCVKENNSVFSQISALCQAEDADNLSEELTEKPTIANQDSNDSDLGFSGTQGGSLQHPTILSSMMSNTMKMIEPKEAPCVTDCLSRIRPSAEMMGLSSDESNSCSASLQDRLSDKPSMFESNPKHATSSEVDSSENKADLKSRGESKQGPVQLTPGLTGLMTEQNTDSTGTSDMDSSENLGNPFGGAQLKHGGRALRRRCKASIGQSNNLLAKLHGKPKQRLSQRPLTRGEKMATGQSVGKALASVTPARPFTEALLQKSLSEECEDLGVDRPSASELFPEADVFLELENTNSSQCFETMQVTSCGLDLIKPVAMFSGGTNLQATEFSSSSLDGSRMSSPALSVSNSNDSKPESNSKRNFKPIEVRAVRSRNSNLVSTCDSNSNDEPEKDANNGEESAHKVATVSPHMTRSRLSLRTSAYDSNSNDETDNVQAALHLDVHNSNPGSVSSIDENDKEIVAAQKDYNHSNAEEPPHKVESVPRRMTRSRASLLVANVDSNSSDGQEKVFVQRRTRSLARTSVPATAGDNSSGEVPDKEITASGVNKVIDDKVSALSPEGTRSLSRISNPASIGDNNSEKDFLDKEIIAAGNDEPGKDEFEHKVTRSASALSTASGGDGSSMDVANKETATEKDREESRSKKVATISLHATRSRSRSLSRQSSASPCDSNSMDVLHKEMEPGQNVGRHRRVTVSPHRTRSRSGSLSHHSSVSACDSNSMDARDIGTMSATNDLDLEDRTMKVSLLSARNPGLSRLGNESNPDVDKVNSEIPSKEITANALQADVGRGDDSAKTVISESSRPGRKPKLSHNRKKKPVSDSTVKEPEPEVKLEPELQLVTEPKLETKLKLETELKLDPEFPALGATEDIELEPIPIPFIRSQGLSQRAVKQYRAKPKAKIEKTVKMYVAMKGEDVNGCSTTSSMTRVDPVNGGSSNSRTLSDAVVSKSVSMAALDATTVPKMMLQIQKKLALNAASILECSNTEASSTLTGTSSSSEDSMPLPDPYMTMSVNSSEVTITSPAMPRSPAGDDDCADACGVASSTLPNTSAAKRFHHTYKRKGKQLQKEHSSSVPLPVKRARPEDPGQYANADSEETWESSSSRDKDGADDEDSSSHSRTELSSEPSPSSDLALDEADPSSSVAAQDNGMLGVDLFSPAPTGQEQRQAGCAKAALQSRKRRLPPSERSGLRSSKRGRMRSHSVQDTLPTICEEEAADLTLDESDAEHADVNTKLRRSSLRGHVKKGCTCCNGLPETSANPKKKDVIKVDTVVTKKSQPPTKKLVKCNNNRKR